MSRGVGSRGGWERNAGSWLLDLMGAEQLVQTDWFQTHGFGERGRMRLLNLIKKEDDPNSNSGQQTGYVLKLYITHGSGFWLDMYGICMWQNPRFQKSDKKDGKE